MGYPAYLEKMTSVRGQDWLAQRGQAFKAPIGPSLFNRSDDRDHEDPLRSNKPEPSKASVGLETPAARKAPPGPPQAPPLLIFQDPDANRYSQ